MTYAIRFRPEVIADLAAAAEWYEGRSSGAGTKFLSEVNATLARVSQSPEIHAAGVRNVRSARLRRFPYLVHYRIEGQTIVILAIHFGGRDPTRWQSRA